MNAKYGALGEQYKPLDDLDGYSVETGDADPRGWTVVDESGQSIGEVDDLIVDTTRMKVRYLAVDQSGNDSAASPRLLDVDEVAIDHNSRRVVARGTASGSAGYAADYAGHSHPSDDATGDRTLTRSEEELRIGKREVQRGEVRVGKRVETEHVSEPVTRRREEVVIERRPVSASDARADISEDEIRVPLVEEELVVDKRAVVKEELVIGKREVEERDVVEADVRRERFEVEGDDVRGSVDVDEDIRRRRGNRGEGR